MPAARHPPHRSVRERLTHTAPTSDDGGSTSPTKASAPHAVQRLGHGLPASVCGPCHAQRRSPRSRPFPPDPPLSRVLPPLALARRLILPSLSVHKVGTRKEVFRGSIGGPSVPLSTLHPRCRHRRRMTRGQRSSLNFRCGALAHPLLPAGFIPALSDRPQLLC